MAESTFGGGLNAPGPTLNRCSTRQWYWTMIDRAAPVTTARAGGQALDHFLLQHEVHVADEVPALFSR
jgi:hypothetical protein